MGVMIRRDDGHTDLNIFFEYDINVLKYFFVAEASYCCSTWFKDVVPSSRASSGLVECGCGDAVFHHAPGARFYLIDGETETPELKEWLHYWAGLERDEIEVSIEW